MRLVLRNFTVLWIRILSLILCKGKMEEGKEKVFEFVDDGQRIHVLCHHCQTDLTDEAVDVVIHHLNQQCS